MYIYTFLLRMTGIMTSQNIDLSFWDTLYIEYGYVERVEKVVSFSQLTISGHIIFGNLNTVKILLKEPALE
jgi:hypothetical protein